MTISAYIGRPGSGKGYNTVANFIIPAVQAGRLICHNMQLKEAALEVVTGKKPRLIQIPESAHPDELIALCEPGALVVIDECWRYFPAGTKANEVPKPHLEFFKKHRHRVGNDGFATDILLQDQNITTIPKWVRDLIDMTYVHRKLNKVGRAKNFRCEIYDGPADLDKVSIKSEKLVRNMLGTYKPEVWNCYVSHTQNESGNRDAGLEELPDKRGNILRSWTFKSAVAAVILLPPLFIGVYNRMTHMVDGGGLKKKPNAEAQAKPQAPPPGTKPDTPPPAGRVTQVAQQPSSGPTESKRWTLRGFITRGLRNVAVLESFGGTRYVSATLCSEEGTDWRCTVDGELVTEWTGDQQLRGLQSAAYTPSASSGPQ